MTRAVPGEKTVDETLPVVATGSATAVAEEGDEVLNDEDKKELEEARKAIASSDEKVVTEPESEEIAALRTAFQAVQDKIGWHETQIEGKQKEIHEHESHIEELRANLRSRFEGMVGNITGQKRGPGRPRKDGSAPRGGGRPRKTYGTGNSTGDLIATFLQKAGKPVDAATLVKHLAEHNNDTNPSVELSRMVKKGLVERPTRGMYLWVAPLPEPAAAAS